MAKSFGSKRGHLLQHLLQHILMNWAVFCCTEQLQFRADLSHLTTGFFSVDFAPRDKHCYKLETSFHIFLTPLSSLLHLWCAPSGLFILSWCHQTFSQSDIFTRHSFVRVIGPYFHMFSFLFVILLYLELLKYLTFVLVLVLKCSAAWKFFNSVIASPMTKIFL